MLQRPLSKLDLAAADELINDLDRERALAKQVAGYRRRGPAGHRRPATPERGRVGSPRSTWRPTPTRATTRPTWRRRPATERPGQEGRQAGQAGSDRAEAGPLQRQGPADAQVQGPGPGPATRRWWPRPMHASSTSRRSICWPAPVEHAIDVYNLTKGIATTLIEGLSSTRERHHRCRSARCVARTTRPRRSSGWRSPTTVKVGETGDMDVYQKPSA